METIFYSETSVDFHLIMRRYIPEDRSLHSTCLLFDYITIIMTLYQFL
jgi:hypothetical protein